MIIQQVGKLAVLSTLSKTKSVCIYRSIILYNSCQMRLVTSTGPPVAVKVCKVQLIVQFKQML